MRSLGFLHISDLHAGPTAAGARLEMDYAVRQLCDDISKRQGFGAQAPEVLLVTGDIGSTAATRSADEYKIAYEYLKKIQSHAGVADDKVFVVPGNHDVDRSTYADDDVRRWLDELRSSRGLSADSLTDLDRERLRQRFNQYSLFEERIMTNKDVVRSKHIPGLWHYSGASTSGLSYTLCGINSALLSLSQDETGKLEVGTAQATFCLDPLADAHASIVMLHHPWGWLRDEALSRKWLSPSTQVFASGHLHSARLIGHYGPDGLESFVLQAGATFIPNSEQDGAPWSPNGGHRYAFGLIEADDQDQYTIRVWPRLFDAGLQKYDIDVQGSASNSPSTEPLSLPQPYRSKRHQQEQLVATTDSKPACVPTELERLADRHRKRIGDRYTAYPQDVSIAELHTRSMLVSPVLRRQDESVRVAGLEVGHIIDRIEAAESVLVLGAPGAGKSVFAYLVLVEARQRGVVLVGVSAGDLTALLAEDSEAKSLRAQVEHHDGKVGILIDGLDELLASGADPAQVSKLLEDASKIAPIVVTARTREYEMLFSVTSAADLFSETLHVQPWRLDVEVLEYLTKMENTRSGSFGLIRQLLDSNAGIAELATRPLYLRMLSSLRPDDVRSIVSDRVSPLAALYGRYLHRLARATERKLLDSGCAIDVSVVDLWRSVAWHVHSKQMMHGGGFDFDLLVRKIKLPASDHCASMALGYLLNVEDDFAKQTANFVHYSLYEYLVASDLSVFLRDAVWGSQEPEAGRVAKKFSQDLSREQRKYLVALVRRDGTGASDLLLATLRELLPLRSNRTEGEVVAANLMVYLCSRVSPERADELASVLENESLPFLRCAGLWSLAHLAWIHRLGWCEVGRVSA